VCENKVIRKISGPKQNEVSELRCTVFRNEERIDLYKSPRFIGILKSRKSRDISVGIALGYGLDDRGSGVRFPAGAENFSVNHRVQNGSGAHPASYPMGTRGSFLGVKRPGREADHSPPYSSEIKE
jgi:hypothetical protein